MDTLFLLSLLCAVALLGGLLCVLWMAYQEFNKEE